MDFKELSKDILHDIGGAQNIEHLEHCATRLRFKLKDNHLADKESLQNREGILSVVESAGQFQVVVGSHVQLIYKELQVLVIKHSDSQTIDNRKETFISKVFGIISGSLTPLLGALAGAGMLKALLIILAMAGLLSKESTIYIVLSSAANAVFYFLPIFLGITIATKLQANPYVGGTIGAALMEPNLMRLSDSGLAFSLFGFPLEINNYASTVFPTFIAVIFYAYIEKLLKRFIHKDMQTFLVPMATLIIVVPLSLLIFGPLGLFIAEGIRHLIGIISDHGLITGAIMGGVWTFLTIFGLHWAIVPININNIMDGGDPLIAMAAAAPLAQMGMALGVYLKTKDRGLKKVTGPTAIMGLFSGVTEPIIYGVLLRYRRTIPIVVFGATLGGAINGFLGAKQIAFAFPAALSIPSFTPMGSFMTGIGSAFFSALILTLLLGFEDRGKSQKLRRNVDNVKPMKDEVIFSPLIGKVQPLKEVDDQVFSSEAMGKGIAIEPTVGKAFAPVNGVVSMLFPTAHAIGITSEEGASILIHIGIDTVKLEGEHFLAKVKQGDQVRSGQLLIEFDIEKIKEAGFKVITPIIITNTTDYVNMIETSDSFIDVQNPLLTLVK